MPEHEATAAHKAQAPREAPAAGHGGRVAQSAPVTGPGADEQVTLGREEDLVVEEEDEVLPPPPVSTICRGFTHKRYRGASGASRSYGRNGGQFRGIADMDVAATVQAKERKREAVAGGGSPSADVTEPEMMADKPEPVVVVDTEQQPGDGTVSQRSPSPVRGLGSPWTGEPLSHGDEETRPVGWICRVSLVRDVAGVDLSRPTVSEAGATVGV